MTTTRPRTARSSRRRSREFALQALYQWQLGGDTADILEKQLRAAKGFDKLDEAYFLTLLRGAISGAHELEKKLQPNLDRPSKELSPIEHCILLLAAYELVHQPDVPYKVVINEAVELAKSFGGTDGHKYVNGVLDKLAARLRSAEYKQSNHGDTEKNKIN
ncbi:MAG TPA: transcription antitermination factor NusB [Burkholderiales bacterium]|nr:transcription antitermination factor NusB [Burkholderiales bacterium]